MAQFIVSFTENLDKCDKTIIEDETEKRRNDVQNVSGWKSWSKWGKTAWIFLNILTLCFPLVLIIAIKRIQNTRLLPSEKQKLSLIDNFEIPDEKGAIIDSLNLIHGKVSSVTAGRVNSKNWILTKTWYAKATQIHTKANILLREDKIENEVFQLIDSKVNKFQKKYRLKTAGIIMLAVVYLFLVGGTVWFMLSRGLIPFVELTNSGIHISPYLWKVYIPLIAFLCIMLIPKIPPEIKYMLLILPWLIVLVVAVVSCGKRFEQRNETKKDAENSLASAVEAISDNNNLTLAQFTVKNTWDGALEIVFTSNSFDPEPIINCEKEIKRVNEDYHYTIEISCITESEIVIRKVKIDEHNILSIEEDNTDGFMEEFLNLCTAYDLKVHYYNKWSDYGMYHFTLRPTSIENTDYTAFAAEAEKLMLQYQYSSVEITVEDSNYKDIFKAKIEVGTKTEITLNP